MRDGKEAILKINGRVSGILLGWDNSTHQVSPLFPALVPKPLKNQFCLLLSKPKFQCALKIPSEMMVAPRSKGGW